MFGRINRWLLSSQRRSKVTVWRRRLAPLPSGSVSVGISGPIHWAIRAKIFRSQNVNIQVCSWVPSSIFPDQQNSKVLDGSTFYSKHQSRMIRFYMRFRYSTASVATTARSRRCTTSDGGPTSWTQNGLLNRGFNSECKAANPDSAPRRGAPRSTLRLKDLFVFLQANLGLGWKFEISDERRSDSQTLLGGKMPKRESTHI